jgi:hypothetical protein
MQDGKLVLVSCSPLTRSVAKTVVSNTKSTDVLLMMNVVTAAKWPFARLKSFVTFQPRMKSKASSQQRNGLRYSSSYGMHMGGVIWCGPTRGSGMCFGVDLLSIVMRVGEMQGPLLRAMPGWTMQLDMCTVKHAGAGMQARRPMAGDARSRPGAVIDRLPREFL